MKQKKQVGAMLPMDRYCKVRDISAKEGKTIAELVRVWLDEKIEEWEERCEDD